MHAPQIVWIILVTFSLSLDLEWHGKPKKGKYSFWLGLVGTALSTALLWWGGFFGGHC